MKEDTEITDFPPSPGTSSSPNTTSLPDLSRQLNDLYSLLGADQRRLFNRVFKWMWNKIIKQSALTGIVFNYWCADNYRLSLGLPTSELSVLSFLFMSSGGGVGTVRSDTLYNCLVIPGVKKSSIAQVLNNLKRKGYITRFCRDPLAPYLAVNVDRHKIFIRFTPSGINLMEKFKYNIDYMTLRSTLADLTDKKKPRNSSGL